MSTESMYIRISTALKNRLTTLASETGLPLTQVVEHVLARGLEMGEETAAGRLNKLINERYGLNGKNPR